MLFVLASKFSSRFNIIEAIFVQMAESKIHEKLLRHYNRDPTCWGGGVGAEFSRLFPVFSN